MYLLESSQFIKVPLNRYQRWPRNHFLTSQDHSVVSQKVVRIQAQHDDASFTSSSSRSSINLKPISFMTRKYTLGGVIIRDAASSCNSEYTGSVRNNVPYI